MTAWTKLADLPGVDQREALGVSAPFAGTHNGSLIVAGGCNFPDKPVAEGGTKRYYDEVFLLGSEGWKMIGHLPTPVAYGAAVSTPEGVICIGGNNADRSMKEVIRLAVSTGGDVLEIDTLPSLPVTMDNMAAAYADGQLFVAGGNANGAPCHSLYHLDLTQNTLAWEALPDFPGPCRVQPVLIAKGNGQAQQLYLAGGFQPVEGEQEALLPTELLTFDTATRTWCAESELPPLADGAPRTLTGGNALLWGDHQILYFGGVNYQKFADAVNRPLRLKAAKAAADTATLDSLRAEAAQYLHHPVEWYRFNTDGLVYDTETKQWNQLGHYEPFARAGAGAVITDQQVTVICGELKPGIRTPQVNQLDIRSLRKR
ncbi:MAG: cyclically-permuted mutarotase family protein [Parabacteroides sp.]